MNSETETSDRRNLTDDQRAMIADAAAELEGKLTRAEQAKEVGKLGGRGNKKTLADAPSARVSEKPRDRDNEPRAKAAKAAKVSERFRIELEAIPASYLAPAHRRLARLLKSLKRAYQFRCLSCRPVEQDAPEASERNTGHRTGFDAVDHGQRHQTTGKMRLMARKAQDGAPLPPRQGIYYARPENWLPNMGPRPCERTCDLTSVAKSDISHL